MTFWQTHQDEQNDQERVRLLYENLLEGPKPYLDTLREDAKRAADGLDTGLVMPTKNAKGECFDLPLKIPKHAITVVAGRTGGGKTTLMSNLAARLAMRKYNGFYLTLEEAAFQINARLMAAFSSLDKPNYSMEWLRFHEAVKVIAGKEEWDGFEKFNDIILSHCRVVDANKSVDLKKVYTPSILYEPQYLADIIGYRNQKCSKPLDFVFVDYVQLMQPNDRTGHERGYERVHAVMQALKNLCGQLGIAVILGAQLNRSVVGESVYDWEPESLREGADIEHSTTLMIGIGRDKTSDDPERQTVIRFMKNRFGSDRAGGLFRVNFASNAIWDKGLNPDA